MPIYAYRCTACNHTQDTLRKISDPALTLCPACNTDNLAKQVTAAGFALKGTGWYVTDFRSNGNGGNKTSSADASGDSSASNRTTTDSAKTDSAKTDSVTTDSAKSSSGGETSSAAPAAPATKAAPASSAATSSASTS